jgi:polar amino acid transport system substrate-binding protein
MQEGAQRIKRIVNDLKDFARRDDTGDRTCIDLNSVVQTSLRLVEPTIRKATSHCRVHLADDLPQILGNAQRIEQVVVTLLLNACQALPAPDRGITVATAYNRSTDNIILTIRDEGVGIAAEHLPRLTDPFFTTKRESGGTGLGLSVSAGIINEHGGQLSFESTPGVGTTVILTLPAVERADS